MQQRIQKSFPSKKFLEVALRTKSWHPVARNGWIIKFSVYKDTNILLTIISQYTGQTIIRHFTDENSACVFINYVQELDAEQEYDL